MPTRVDTHEQSEHDSFNVPIKQKLMNLPAQACDACGNFKSAHPTATSALMLIAVFCLGIVTSAAVGKLFVTQQHYYVSTDPHAREIHQALDTLLGHYRSGKDAMGDTLGAAGHTVKSYYHAAKGAGESAYVGSKEGLLSGMESAKASLDGAKATLEGYVGGKSAKHKAESKAEHMKDSVLGYKDTLASRLSDASSSLSDKLQEAKDSLLAGKDAAADKIQDTLHPHENQFMKIVHEAENKIASFIKQRA